MKQVYLDTILLIERLHRQFLEVVKAELDRLAGPKGSRSAVIEQVLRKYFRERARRRIHQRDFERINAAADRLNAEAEEVLVYQAPEG